MMDEVLRQAQQEMERTLGALRRELGRVRTGRASTALLEGITVDYYGARTPLNQLASLSTPDPRQLLIQPYDPSVIGEVEKAILRSDLGLTPMNDGKVIRIPIPELTEERRHDLVKQIRRLAEEFRVSVRNHRRDANERLKALRAEKKLSEDDLRDSQEKVQDLTRSYTEQVDEVLAAKEREVMAV